MSKLKLTMMGFATFALIVGGAMVVQSLTQSPEERVIREIEVQAHELLHGRTALQEARDELVAAVREAGLDGADIRRAFKQVDTHLETADKRYRKAEAHAGKLERVDEGSGQWARLIERIAVELETAEGALSQAEQGLTGIARVLLEPNEICPAVYQPVCGVDGNTYPNACHAQRVEIAYGGVCEKADPTWTSIGPGGGGWLTAIAIDPQDANTVYVGSDVGGMVKSTDGGETFKFINNGLKSYVIQDIKIDPKSTNIVYVATTDGVYKSVDGGRNWTLKRNGFPPLSNVTLSAPINAIGIDPGNPNIVYAGIGAFIGKGRTVELEDTNLFDSANSKGEIYKSTNGGDTWTKYTSVARATIFDIEVSPQNSNTVFATTDKGFLKSIDGGRKWQRKTQGLPYDDVRGLATHPSNPKILYLTVFDPGGRRTWKGGVYKSTDGGETWEPKNNNLLTRNDGPGQMTSNYPDVIVDLGNPNILYTGDFSWGSIGIYKSTNGGETWQPLIDVNNAAQVAQITETSYFPNADTNIMALGTSNSQVLYFGGAYHLYKTSDGGKNWQPATTKKTGPNTWQLRGIETSGVIGGVFIDPNNSNIIYLGVGDLGLFQSTDGGETFKHLLSEHDGPFKDGSSVVVDPDNQGTVYVIMSFDTLHAPGELKKSTDYGKTWTTLSGKGSGLPEKGTRFALVLDPGSPVNSRTLYMTIFQKGVYKSTDSGKTWKAVNKGLRDLDVLRLAMAPQDPNVLYVASVVKGGVYKTTNGGETWKWVKQIGEDCCAIAIHPKDSNIIFIGSRRNQNGEGGIHRSTDGGTTWTKVLDERWISALAIRPDNPNIIYAATNEHPLFDQFVSKGLYKSTDGGTTWKLIPNQPPYTNIMTITLDPNDPRIIYLGTDGGGVLRGVEE